MGGSQGAVFFLENVEWYQNLTYRSKNQKQNMDLSFYFVDFEWYQKDFKWTKRNTWNRPQPEFFRVMVLYLST